MRELRIDELFSINGAGEEFYMNTYLTDKGIEKAISVIAMASIGGGVYATICFGVAYFLGAGIHDIVLSTVLGGIGGTFLTLESIKLSIKSGNII